jgi:DtxR family Mn-dependent transcriptional regulator
VSSANFSDAVQDYLREIYKLQGEHAPVKTSILARQMGVAPPSATAMVKKLAALGSPTEGPHGAPIPDARLRIVRPAA